MITPLKYAITILKNLGAFFPVRLLIDYLKYNRLILLSWLLPFLFITGKMGEKFGIQTLFLTPQYMGSVNGIAFLFSGLAAGSFIMAFHIASYVVMAHRYPLIVRFSKPFYRYSLNNSFIPFVYITLFLVLGSKYLKTYELQTTGEIVFNMMMFLAGTAFFIYFSFGFFYFIVRVIPGFSDSVIRFLKSRINSRPGILKYLTEKDAANKINESPIGTEKKDKVKYYLFSFFKIKPAGKYDHFSKNEFKKVFQVQHVNAFSYVTFVLILIIIRGLIKDIPELILPASASFYVILTVVVLITSLLYIVFEKWAVIVIFFALFLFGYVSPFNMMSYNDSAYGMDYSKKRAINVYDHGDFTRDSLNTIEILNRWKKKNTPAGSINYKPRMVVMVTSGGGLKMAVWTYFAMGYADSILQGDLLKHTQLITGASGGMLGAAYLRENYLRFLDGKEKAVFSAEKTNKLSKDILNPVFYTFAMSDWFFRLQSFKYNHKTYFKDRAYVFEQTLNRNIGNVLDKPLHAYQKPVTEAKIPMMILTPGIENVGSRLFITSTNVSYLTKSEKDSQIKNIELRNNYALFQPDSLRYLTAIRMNASFPYVSPDVELPGRPKLYLIDAGLNDNFGIMTAYQFICEFKEWIQQNTSGIILIRLDEKPNVDYRYFSSHVKSMLRPVGSVFTDWINIQEDNYLTIAGSLNKMLPGQFEMMTFYFGGEDKHVPLSWNITQYDKQILFNSIKSVDNQQNIDELKKKFN